MLKQIIKLCGKRRIGLRRAVCFFQVEDKRHEGFGNITSAKLAEMAAFVWLVAKRIGSWFVHLFESIKPLAFRGGVGVGAVRLKLRLWKVPTPDPSPKGEGRLKHSLVGQIQNRLAEGRNLVHILDARTGFDAGRNINESRASDTDRLGNIARIQPTGKPPG